MTKTSVSHEELLTSSIIGHFCFPYQGCGQETKKTTETYTGMLRQHSSITKGGNGTISLLTGKSCHSLPQRHSSFPLKMERVLLTALRLISGSKGMHAIWICDRARACVCSHTLAGMHRLRDVSWAAAGCVCVQTQSVNSYWMGGGEATRLKGMRGETGRRIWGGYYGAWLQTAPHAAHNHFNSLSRPVCARHLFLTRPIFKLWYSPPLDLSSIDLPYQV